MTELLDREEFRMWLATREPDERVGLAATTWGCAVASYVEQALEYREVTVDEEGLKIGSPYRVFDLPDWAEEFIASHDDRRIADPVTAKEALTILDSIPKSKAND